MKRVLLLIIYIVITSCIDKNMSFYPDTIEESRKKRLLVAIYEPSQRQVKIGKNVYLIEEAWTTYKTKSKDSKEINPYSKRFQIVVSPIGNREEKGVKLYDLDKDWEYGGMVKHILKDTIYPTGYYNDGISVREEIDDDTIKIEFLDDKKNKTIVDFTKLNR